MCEGCWREEGSPTIDSPAVRHASDCVRRLHAHPRGATGGALHIVTDDWNVDDKSVRGCKSYIGRCEREAMKDPTNGRGDLDRYRELTALEQACFDAFLGLNVQERTSALAFGRFWEPQGIAVK